MSRSSAVSAVTIGSSISAPTSTTYFPTLDGLRFFAFLLVFVHHVPRSANPILGFLHDQGWVGVHIFLLLSAYLLTAILSSERSSTQRISIAKFYLRRGLRIWPLYYLFCAACLVFALARHPEEASYLARFGGLAIFADNIVSGFRGYNPLPYVGHLWTISLEEQFYLVLPLLLDGWLWNHRVLATRLLFVWAGFLATRIGCVLLQASHPLIWTSVFSADALLIGTVLGAIRWRPTVLTFSTRLFLVVGGIFGVFSGGILPPLAEVGLHQVFIYTTVAIGAALLLMAALHEPLLTFLGSRPLRYLGKISYGLYVFHLVGIGVGTKLQARAATGDWWFLAIASLLATVGLSVVSYELLEKRILRFKHRFETIHTRPI